MQTGIALVVLLLGGLVAWAYPRPHGDLFLGLAGGRDVLNGRLGAPDDWSFITAGRVWLHQNWGADTLLVLADRWGGSAGLLALKGLLVAGIAGAMIFAARIGSRRGLAIAVVCAAAGLAAWPQGMGLRGNLFSLVFTPVLVGLLLRQSPGFRIPAGIVLLMLAWGNIHGGFMFGLGILGLWTLTRLIAAVRREGWTGALRTERLVLGQLVLSLLATGLANPHGVRNLLLPFRLLTESEWRTVNEWRSFLEGGIVQYRTPWIFLVLGATALAGLLWTLGRRRGGEAPPAQTWFELLLALTVFGMGLRSERFLLFASVLLAPLAARRLEVVARTGRTWVAPLLAGLLLMFMVQQYRWIPRFYQDDNPLRPVETFAQRMIFEGTHFPDGAAEFLRRNDISAPVFQEWRWEGFLRWRCPGVRVFVGGRAQQIYTEAHARRRVEIVTSERPGAILAELEAPLAVVPLDTEYGHFVLRLLRDPDHRWAYLYCDRISTVLVNLDTPLGGDLAGRAVSGQLRYPSALTASLSVGLHLASPALNGNPADAFRLLKGAVEQEPIFFAYQMMIERGLAAGEPPDTLCTWLEEELRRLEGRGSRGPEGIAAVDARRAAAGVLARLYQARGMSADAERTSLHARRAELEGQALREAWTPPN